MAVGGKRMSMHLLVLFSSGADFLVALRTSMVSSGDMGLERWWGTSGA